MAGKSLTILEQENVLVVCPRAVFGMYNSVKESGFALDVDMWADLYNLDISDGYLSCIYFDPNCKDVLRRQSEEDQRSSVISFSPQDRPVHMFSPVSRLSRRKPTFLVLGVLHGYGADTERRGFSYLCTTWTRKDTIPVLPIE